MNDTTGMSIDQAAESLLVRQTEAVAEEPKAELQAEEVEAETAQAEAEPNEVEGEEAEAEGESPDEDEGQEENDDEAEAPATYTVKVDGKEVAVTLDELQRSYSGQAYIQKGMQEAAAARKEAESLAQTLLAEQQKFVEVFQKVQSQGIINRPVAPDVQMSKTDPIGYLQADAAYRQEMATYQEQQQQIQAVTQQQSQLQKAAQAEYLNEQRKLLAERIPELSDPQKGPEIQGRIRKVAGDAYGFTEQELGAVMDARHVQVLHDAMRWRELQSGKVAPKMAAPPKVVKPHAKMTQAPQVARQKQIEKARNTGRLQDFASLLLEKR